jgi:predicted phage replisome organizer
MIKMAETKKYYWLKLKRDFFKRHDVRIIEEMPNGKDYILFYLKLLLESIDHEGALRFSDTIPYNEQMLSVITNTNIDVVKSAMRIFIELKMIDIFDDSTIYMTDVEKYIGSETEWARKKRLQRAKEDNVPLLSSECPTELDKELKKELKKEKEIITTTTTGTCAGEDVDNSPSVLEVTKYFEETDPRFLTKSEAYTEASKFHAYNAMRGWDCLPDWQKAADLWMARIDDKRG